MKQLTIILSREQWAGFPALPGGELSGFSSNYFWLGPMGFWWSSTQYPNYKAKCVYMGCSDGIVNFSQFSKYDSYSVRCLKDTVSLPELTVILNSTNNLCQEDTIGTASVEIISGTTPYSILWSTGATTDSIFDLAVGEYFVTISDAAYNTAIDTIEVTQTAPVSIELGNNISI